MSLFVLGSFVVSCSAKVAAFPRAGESLRARALTVEPGGKGFNQAVGARRLGAEVDGLLAVGDDLFGQFAQAAVAQADLPSAMLRQYPAKTGAGVGFINTRGENCLAVHPGANLELSAADVAACAAQISRAAITLAQFEIADAPIIEAFRLARAAGASTLLNPSPLRPLDPQLWESTSILVVNAIEAAQLAASLGGDDDAPLRPPTTRDEATAIARRLLALGGGPEIVIITLGPGGAIARQRDQSPIYQDAFQVDGVVDTLGAGDAFIAALAVSFHESRSLESSLRRACASGALVASRTGVFTALPTAQELQRFLSRT